MREWERPCSICWCLCLKVKKSCQQEEVEAFIPTDRGSHCVFKLSFGHDKAQQPPSKSEISKIDELGLKREKRPKYKSLRTQQMKSTDGRDCMFRLSLGHDKAFPASKSRRHLDLRHPWITQVQFISLESPDSPETQIPVERLVRSPRLPVPICLLCPYLVVASVRTPSRIAWTIVSTCGLFLKKSIFWI